MKEENWICDICGNSKKEQGLPKQWNFAKLSFYTVEYSFEVCDVCFKGPKKNIFQKIWHKILEYHF